METGIPIPADVELDTNLPIFPAKINGFPVKVLKSGKVAIFM